MFETIIALIVFSLDQLTKLYIRYNFEIGDQVQVIPSVFNLTYVMNKGAAFGIFSNLESPLREIVLGGLSLFAIFVVIRILRNEAKGDVLSRIALVSILAGALGNITDRIYLGSVVDFLDFYYKNYHWPAFNVADSAISIGVCILILRIRKLDKV